MRFLLDECLPRKLKRHLSGHIVRTVPEMGWAGLKNGELFALAEGRIEVFVTSDQNIPHQQSLKGRSFALLVLVAHDNQLETLAPLLRAAEAAIAQVQPGELIFIGEEAEPGER